MLSYLDPNTNVFTAMLLMGLFLVAGLAIGLGLIFLVMAWTRARRINAMFEALDHAPMVTATEYLERADIGIGGVEWGWIFFVPFINPYWLGTVYGTILKKCDRRLPGQDFGDNEEVFEYIELAKVLAKKSQKFIDSFLAGAGKRHSEYAVTLNHHLNRLRSKLENDKVIEKRKKAIEKGIRTARTGRSANNPFGEEVGL